MGRRESVVMRCSLGLRYWGYRLGFLGTPGYKAVREATPRPGGQLSGTCTRRNCGTKGDGGDRDAVLCLCPR